MLLKKFILTGSIVLFFSITMEFGWQYIFPSKKPGIDPISQELKQHYHNESFLQKSVKNAVREEEMKELYEL